MRCIKVPTKFNARISAKHDTEAKWNLIADTFVPLNGEIIVYHAAEVPFDDEGNIKTSEGVRIKIGDGQSTLSELGFVYIGLENAVLSHVTNSEIHLSALDRQRLQKVDSCVTAQVDYIEKFNENELYCLVLEK